MTDKMSAEELAEIGWHALHTMEQDQRHKAIFFDTYVERLLSHITALQAEPDALREALSRLRATADYLLQNYLLDEIEDRNLCIDDDHWAAIKLLRSATDDAAALGEKP